MAPRLVASLACPDGKRLDLLVDRFVGQAFLDEMRAVLRVQAGSP